MKKRRRALLLAVGVALAASSAVASLLAWRARQPFWLEDPSPETYLRTIAFSASDEWLAGQTASGAVSLWSLRDRELRHHEPSPGDDLRAYGLAFTPTGQLVFERGGASATLHQVPGGEAAGTIGARSADRVAGGLAGDGDLLARTLVAPSLATVEIWDVSHAPRFLSRLDFVVPHEPDVELALRSSRIVVGRRYQTSVSVRETATGRGLRQIGVEGFFCLALSPRADEVAAGAAWGLSVEQVSVDGAARRRIELPSPTGGVPRRRPEDALSRRVFSVDYSPDGRTLAAACIDDGSEGGPRSWVVLEDVAGERPAVILTPESMGLTAFEGRGEIATAVRFSHSGELIAVAFGTRVSVLHAP